MNIRFDAQFERKPRFEMVGAFFTSNDEKLELRGIVYSVLVCKLPAANVEYKKASGKDTRLTSSE